MKTSIVSKKFRSVRDKNGSHRRNKSAEPGLKARPMSAEAFFAIFKTDSARQAQKEKEEEERENAKVVEIHQILRDQNLDDVSTEHIRFSLNSKYAAGDPQKAVELLRLQQQAFAGIIQPYNPNQHMLGAENRGGVTCYLDALLFAMFSKLDAFESMLKNDVGDENQRRLAALIRLWVNMLRSGKLIHTDMTQNIQEALARCGWKEAEELEQQDTSEAFAFITETLQFPLLTLQVDLFHQGKGDKDDHKVVHERLLNLAVPPDPEGKGIKLEDCLEEYFNNKVDVLRDSLDDKQHEENAQLKPQSTIRIVAAEDHQTAAGPVTVLPSNNPDNLQPRRRWTSYTSNEAQATTSADPAPTLRHRSTSVIQRIVLNNEGHPQDSDPSELPETAKVPGSTVVKAITIPAWQFFRLIPWHVPSELEPRNDVEVARHLNQRPVVGICLKRYTMTPSGVPVRQNTFIDIPDSLRLPYFMMADEAKPGQEVQGLSSEYKLVLQSVVCHRGDSLHSGHYIAFARVAPKLLTDNRRHDVDPPPDYEEAQWVKFDDLALENRVSYVDDIKQSLRDEMPYLLFYQIVPMVDVTAASSSGSIVEPPSYDASAVKVPGVSTQPPTPNPEVEHGEDISRSNSGYFDSLTTVGSGSAATGRSIRFSSELERPTRMSLDEDQHFGGPYLRSSGSRSGSATHLSDRNLANPESHSPATTPGEESTATRLSRAAARFTRGSSKSRPTSQAGEGRISLTMSRLGGLMRPTSKEPLVDEPMTNAAEEGEDSTEQQAQAKKLRARLREREKDKGKGKESKQGVPERECVVM